MTSAIAFVVFPLAMAFAAISDLLSMTIPNRVPVLLGAAYLALGLLVGAPAGEIAAHLGIGCLALAVTFGFFAAGWMGGGDAKLLAATALWFGPTAAMAEYVLLAAVYGGVLTLGLLTLRAWLHPVTNIGFVDRLLEPKTGIPYGIALGVAGLVAYSGSPWMDLAVSGSL